MKLFSKIIYIDLKVQFSTQVNLTLDIILGMFTPRTMKNGSMQMMKVFESKIYKWIPHSYIYFFITENDKLLFFICQLNIST